MKEKLPIIQKAWTINTSNLREDYGFYNDNIYYGTRGKAKKEALVDNDACVVKNTNKNVKFTDILIKRNQNYDKVNFRGKIIKRYEIDKYLRKDKINKLNDDDKFLIQDRRNYIGNYLLFHGCGYTSDINKAEIFTGKQIKSMHIRDTDIIWKYEHILEKKTEAVDMQKLQNDYSL